MKMAAYPIAVDHSQLQSPAKKTVDSIDQQLTPFGMISGPMKQHTYITTNTT